MGVVAQAFGRTIDVHERENGWIAVVWTCYETEDSESECKRAQNEQGEKMEEETIKSDMKTVL